MKHCAPGFANIIIDISLHIETHLTIHARRANTILKTIITRKTMEVTILIKIKVTGALYVA